MHRQRDLNGILLVCAAVAAALLAVSLAATPGVPGAERGSLLTLQLAEVGALALFGGVYLLNRFVSVDVASAVFLLALPALVTVSVEPGQVVGGANLIALAVPVVAASVLLRPTASFWAAGYCTVVLWFTGFAQGHASPNLLGAAALLATAFMAWLASRHVPPALRDLAESEERFRGIFEASPILIALYDAAGDLVKVNRPPRNAASTTELPPPPSNLFSDEALPPDLIAAVRRGVAVRTVLAYDATTGKRVDDPSKATSGLVYLDLHITPLSEDVDGGFLAQAMDVTERRRAEAALRAERDFARSLIDTAPLMIAVLDPQGRTVSVNPAFERIMGYTSDEMLGRDWVGTLVVERELPIYRALQAQSPPPADSLSGTVTAVTKSGREVSLEWYGKALLDSSGEVTGILAISTDITERLEAERARSAMRSISEAAQGAAGLTALCASLHAGVKELMPAENFYIALTEEDSGLVSFPYFVDTVDYPGGAESFPEPAVPGGVTGYVLASGKPLLASGDGIRRLVDEGGVELRGSIPHSYLAVPLKDSAGKSIGVVAVQSYDSSITYGERERELLEFAAQQAGMALQKRKAEDALRQSERMLASVYQQTPTAITVSKVDDGTFLAVNDGFTRITGWQREEAVGRTVAELGIYRDLSQRSYVLACLQEGTARDLEVTFMGKDGHEIPTLLSAEIVEFQGKPCIVTSVTDMSARIAAERARQESEERYRLLFTEMLNGFALLEAVRDQNGEPCDFRYIEVNPAWERMTGLPAQDVVGRTLLEVLPGTDKEWLDAYAQVVLTEKPATFTKYHPHLGRYYDVSVFSSQPGRLAVISADVSERKAMEEALRRERDLARNLLNTAPVLIVVLDPSGNVVSMNPCAEQTVGYSEEELRGVNWFTQLVPAEDRETTLERFRAALNGHDAAGASNHILTKDGRQALVAWHTSVLYGSGGEANHLLCIGYDLTEKRQLEEQLTQAQKMETVGRLAGGIAHDFNNLLTAISGHATFALDEIEPGHEARDDIAQVIAAASRAADLTQQLLAFSRRQIIEPKVLDLNALIADMDRMLRRLIGEDIILVTEPAEGLWPVRADRSQIEQVLVNLAVNARDAMRTGGRLTIETANTILSDEYVQRHLGAAPGDYVMLAVSDTGVGMDAAVKEHLFEPFFTTKGVGEGTGLGLATVYGIVKQHNGDIHVYSEPGTGSTFRVYLPRAENAGGPAPRQAADSDLPTGTETILLTEDEPTVRSVAARVLKDLGYEVLEANDADDALRLLSSNTDVHLLLTDVVMPRMSGRNLATKARGFHPGLRVLYTSGYTDNAIVHHGVLDDGVEFLQKPFTAAALARKVRAVLDAPAGNPPQDGPAAAEGC